MEDKDNEEPRDGRTAEEVSAEAKLRLVDSVVNTPKDQLSSMTSLQPNLVTPLSMTEVYEKLTEILELYINHYEDWMKRHQKWLEDHAGDKVILWGPPVTAEDLEKQAQLDKLVNIHLTEAYRMSLYKHRRSVGGVQRMATIDLAKEEMAMTAPEEGVRDPEYDD